MGNLKKVKKFLGRNWCIEGRVEKGRQLGKKIGFPTCNIDIKNYKIPKIGVYAVKVSSINIRPISGTIIVKNTIQLNATPTPLL